MRHVSHRVVARAAAVVAVLIAVPVATVRAQVNTTKPVAHAQISVSGSPACDDQPAAANTSSELTAKCVVNTVDPNTLGAYTAAATGHVTPGVGGSIHLSTSFAGPSPGVTMSALGAYLEYVHINPLEGHSMNDIANIFLSSDVTFMASSDVPSFTAIDNLAELDQGGLNPDGTPNFGSVQTAFNFWPQTPGDDPFQTQSFTLQTSISHADLAGWSTFFFVMAAQTDNIVFQADPNTSTDNLFLSPTVQLMDPNGGDITPFFNVTFDPPIATTTPEPASVILTLTGLASLGGFARRRRRRAPEATE
jgi:hypothetical protein